MTTEVGSGWVVLRRAVTLAGRVTGAEGRPAVGGTVSMTAAGTARRYQARIRTDGFYFFLDLPAGDYLLDGQDERGNVIEAKRVSIPTTSGAERPRLLGNDLIATAKQAVTVDGRR